ncbi:non-hydrolyzing UDP-N-acetylglucosamine 2-epimerase [Croceicoccus sp. BE223]|uniref:non-hydrolyzing UDP-N-acetylglucosamine 2-epimerase n=1 Tax=Croceicoccus sp. BE223 TaxID=2817716 RepID=UPI00285C3118|nr:UDP-N-acetylglucosamine 2-epimerase (non-hydrolyzing) [Croceicoccus sp. BE223]MDR7102169.1 UDP-N-acetylglucosamine 2-epimerase (non-hydrolyzing) [Croceicoccus sp. BE223]
MIVAGTRPELVKLAPVALALRADGALPVTFCHSGQHADLGQDVLAAMSIVVDARMTRPDGSDLGDLLGGLIAALGAEMERVRPRAVVVQGDTATTLAGALAAFHRRIPVAHVEAGLRSGDMAHPWPEEGYRRLVSPLAHWHFAPTSAAKAALEREGVAGWRIERVGNTVVDALHRAIGMLDAGGGSGGEVAVMAARDDRPLVLATIHRRETGPERLAAIGDGLAALVREHGLRLILPLHPRGESAVLRDRLGGIAGVTLTGPLDYLDFVRLMRAARLIVSDSGGVVEEATALGRPVLVLREATERPEALAAGTARMVGHDPAALLSAARMALAEPMPVPSSVFGDGRAAERIAARLTRDLSR